MKVYQAIAAELARQQVDTIFTLMGAANLPFIVSFGGDQSGRIVNTVAEGGAVSMSDGYARATGKIGVASVTHGPALTNAVTALTEAVRAGTPLLLLASDTPARSLYNRQSIDVHGSVAFTGAAYVRSGHAANVAKDVGRAVAMATLERRPVVLDIPVDVLQEDVEYHPSAFHPERPQAVYPDAEALDEALGVIASARRPVILAGRGAVFAGAREALIKLADLCKAPTATTVAARDFFRGYKGNLGICGSMASPSSYETILQSDCVIAFGAGLNERTTSQGTLLDKKAVIQCDNTPSRLDRYQSVTVAIAADARLTAEAMVRAIREAGIFDDREPWRPNAADTAEGTTAEGTTAAGTAGHEGAAGEGRVEMFAALAALDRVLPSNRSIVTDSGRYLDAAWPLIHVEDPHEVYGTHNFGAIGLGLATSVGVAAARRDILTVAVLGDGGGMMGMLEFSTAVRERLNLLVVIVNDGYYGAERDKLIDFGFDTKYARTDWPSFAELARAMGGRAQTVQSIGDIERLGEIGWGPDAPATLIEVRCHRAYP